jgi:hypothetical protein
MSANTILLDGKSYSPRTDIVSGVEQAMKDQATKDKALKLRMSCVGYNLITNKTLRASNSAGMHPAFGVNA